MTGFLLVSSSVSSSKISRDDDSDESDDECEDSFFLSSSSSFSVPTTGGRELASNMRRAEATGEAVPDDSHSGLAGDDRVLLSGDNADDDDAAEATLGDLLASNIRRAEATGEAVVPGVDCQRGFLPAGDVAPMDRTPARGDWASSLSCAVVVSDRWGDWGALVSANAAAAE